MRASSERGLAVTDTMGDQEVWQLIFEAGFSTAEQVTDVSGRGVGMDVVKRNIAALGGSVEIESADDFVLTGETKITSATFTGLITGSGPLIGAVDVEIYRVFPLDSTFPPSGNVVTRTNSPSDVELDDRATAAGTLSFTTSTLAANFTAANSVGTTTCGAGCQRFAETSETQGVKRTIAHA